LKILDRYIFMSFIKTFFTVFIILILIFLLQAVWVYISELAGKDLDAWIVARLLFYIIPNLIPMVLPLTILVASIMTFGSFAENYEFAAMKSSGISLQRAMRSLIFFISILSVTTFFFANDVIPWSRYKTINMRRNIAKLKPALSITEGTFNQINEYNIKVAKKSGKNGEYLHDVIIHLKNPNNQGLTLVKAKEGKLESAENSDMLTLNLYDGTLYQRQYPRDFKQRQRRPFIKNNFESYKFNIDLSGFNEVDFDDNKFDDAASMLNISELRVSLDSLSQRYNQDRRNFSENLMARSGMQRILGNLPDTMPKFSMRKNLEEAQEIAKVDSIETDEEEKFDIRTLEDFFNSYDVNLQTQMVNLALTSTQGTVRTIKGKRMNFAKKEERLNVTEIEIFDKYALAVMCYVLFFVGAPLGAIIRKGGIGMPMVVAIVLFLIYYYIGMFAKNSAKDGSISPFIATWLSTFIMLPLSILVTYRATTDQAFFNPETVLGPIRKFFAKIGLAKRKKKNKS